MQLHAVLNENEDVEHFSMTDIKTTSKYKFNF